MKKKIREVIYCGLTTILELENYSFMDALSYIFHFPHCLRVDLLLFQVLMPRSIVSLECGK
jgi:hypothetical protein